MPHVAVPKSVELFNRAAKLELGDVEQAMQLRFQLLQLLKRQPNDPMLRIGLINSCRVAGFRDEALAHADAAAPILASAMVAGRQNYASWIGCLGRSDQAASILREIISSDPSAIGDDTRESAAISAFFAGDLPYIQYLAGLEASGGTVRYASDTLAALADLKLLPALPRFQCAILDVMADVQMDAMFKLAEHPDDGRRFLSLRLYIDASKAHRFDVADVLNDRLDEVFADFPQIQDDWWWRLLVTVHAAPRHSSLPAAPRARLAA